MSRWVFQQESQAEVETLLGASLFDPLHEFLNRPRKGLRSQMVNIGFELATRGLPNEDEQDLLRRCGQAVEAWHASTLILDDIEDGSSFRRGKPCLHHQIGTPLAINAGNWLSVFASNLILQSEASDALKSRCLKEASTALLKAHQGQALDLCVRMSETPISQIPTLCRQSLEWKSGAIMELGIVLGAQVAGCDGARLDAIRMLGREMGIALQMFDDLDCLAAETEQPQNWEPARLERPSFLWWLLIEEFPEKRDRFLNCVRDLPDVEPFRQLLTEIPFTTQGRARARGHLRWTYQNFAVLGGELEGPAFQKIEDLAEKFSGRTAH